MTLQEFVSKLPGRVQSRGDFNAQGQCPAHDDRIASLSLGVGNNGAVLLHCHAGCRPEQVVKALGLKLSDLMPENGWKAPRPEAGRREIAWYDYRDADGGFLYQVVRFEPKDFRQRRLVDGEWVWNLEGVKRVPYHLPELLKADPELPVWIFEGEKDADNVAALGHLTTTNAMGVEKWSAGWAEFFRGRSVIIVPDNDEAGRHHAEDVKKKLGRQPAAVMIYRLEGVPEKGDISDFLAQPHEFDPLAEILADLRFILDSRDEYTEEKQRERPNSTSVEDMSHIRIEYPVGNLDERLFCPQNVGCIYGPGGVYKTWMAMYLGGQLARELPFYNMKTRRSRVLIFSEEMTLPEIKMRRDLLWTPEEIISIGHELRFRFDSDFDFFADTNESEKRLHDAVMEDKATFWFIDSLSRIHGGDENKNSDMLRVGRSLERVARVTNSAGVVIHHQGKGGGDPKYQHQGSARIRGASALQNAFSDILNFSPMRKSGGNPRTLVSLEKTRHQRTPAPFGIVPTFDAAGRFDIEFFTPDERVAPDEAREISAAEDALKLVSWMVASFLPGRRVGQLELLESYLADSKTGKHRSEAAILFAREKNMIGWERTDKKGRPVEVWVLPELTDV